MRFFSRIHANLYRKGASLHSIYSKLAAVHATLQKPAIPLPHAVASTSQAPASISRRQVSASYQQLYARKAATIQRRASKSPLPDRARIAAKVQQQRAQARPQDHEAHQKLGVALLGELFTANLEAGLPLEREDAIVHWQLENLHFESVMVKTLAGRRKASAHARREIAARVQRETEAREKIARAQERRVQQLAASRAEAQRTARRMRVDVDTAQATSDSEQDLDDGQAGDAVNSEARIQVEQSRIVSAKTRHFATYLSKSYYMTAFVTCADLDAAMWALLQSDKQFQLLEFSQLPWPMNILGHSIPTCTADISPELVAEFCLFNFKEKDDLRAEIPKWLPENFTPAITGKVVGQEEIEQAGKLVHQIMVALLDSYE